MPLMRGGRTPARSDERLGFLFAVARDPMLILEAGPVLSECIIVDSNQKALELFGFRRGTLLGKPLSFLEVAGQAPAETPGDRESVQEALHRRADGQVLTLERHAQPIQSGDRDFLLVAFHDVTTARLLEKSLLRVQQMDNVGVLSGTLVHDFRNLLATILANAELALSETPHPDDPRERIAEILHSARRATELIERVLPADGGEEQRLRPLDLDSVVADALALIRPSLADNIELRHDLADRGLTIAGDATQIRQIVMNLVINAAEAIAPSRGTIRVSTAPIAASRINFQESPLPVTDPGDHWVCLDVSDTGCGIDAATRSRIFEPLFTTKPTGTGLGLTAVMYAVRRHGGAILLHSAPGKGATFRVLFPLLQT